MAKLILNELAVLNDTAIAAINSNSDAIVVALENTLSRDGTTPNVMESTLDMNSNRILNLLAPVTDTEPLRKGDVDVTVLEDYVTDAQAAAELAEGFSDSAETFSETSSSAAVTAVAAATTVTINTQTNSYTLQLVDSGQTVELNNAGPVSLVIPTNTNVAFPIGSFITVVQIGAGTVTLSPAVGVTIRARTSLISSGQYAVMGLYKRATNEWVAGGDLDI